MQINKMKNLKKVDHLREIIALLMQSQILNIKISYSIILTKQSMHLIN